jgi:hypothetical protein
MPSSLAAKSHPCNKAAHGPQDDLGRKLPTLERALIALHHPESPLNPGDVIAQAEERSKLQQNPPDRALDSFQEIGRPCHRIPGYKPATTRNRTRKGGSIPAYQNG